MEKKLSFYAASAQIVPRDDDVAEEEGGDHAKEQQCIV